MGLVRARAGSGGLVEGTGDASPCLLPLASPPAVAHDPVPAPDGGLRRPAGHRRDRAAGQPGLGRCRLSSPRSGRRAALGLTESPAAHPSRPRPVPTGVAETPLPGRMDRGGSTARGAIESRWPHGLRERGALHARDGERCARGEAAPWSRGGTTCLDSPDRLAKGSLVWRKGHGRDVSLALAAAGGVALEPLAGPALGEARRCARAGGGTRGLDE